MLHASNLFWGAAQLITVLLQAYIWIIVAQAVASWLNVRPWNPVVRFLRAATEPLYRRLHRLCPWLIQGGLDFAPLVVLLGIYLLQSLAVDLLLSWSLKLSL